MCFVSGIFPSVLPSQSQPAVSFALERLALVAFLRKPFQHVSCENATTRKLGRKLGPLFHQIKNRVFSLAADNGQAAQIDYQRASVQVQLRIPPSSTKLIYPRINELSFHHQPAFKPRVDDRNSEHVQMSYSLS